MFDHLIQSHTPGPWVEDACEIKSKDGSSICEMFARSEDDDKWGNDYADANSRLICAAPEMLEALKAFVLSQYSEQTVHDHEVARIKARAAIAKAEGVAIEPNDYAMCVHCSSFHRINDDHKCKDGE